MKEQHREVGRWFGSVVGRNDRCSFENGFLTKATLNSALLSPF